VLSNNNIENEANSNNLSIIPPAKVIIDTDCALGKFWRDVDDGLALVMALNSPELKILGITTVYGNASLREVNKHTSLLLKEYKKTHNRSIPIQVSGADKPLHKLFPELKKNNSYNDFIREFLQNLSKEEPYDERLFPKKYFTNNSLHKLELIKEGKLFPAIKFIKDTIEKSCSSSRNEEKSMDGVFKFPKDKIYLVPIGPLTNIVLLLMIFPRIFKYIDGLNIMGGKLGGWEFNFSNDPIATKIILEMPKNINVKIRIMGLEVCTAQFFSKKHIQELRKRNKDFSQFLYKKIRSWYKLNRFLHGFKRNTGFYPFDPTAILSLIRPKYIEYKKVLLDFQIPKYFFTANPKIKTILIKTINEDKNKKDINYIEWAIKINSKEFMNLLISRLK